MLASSWLKMQLERAMNQADLVFGILKLFEVLCLTSVVNRSSRYNRRITVDVIVIYIDSQKLMKSLQKHKWDAGLVSGIYIVIFSFPFFWVHGYHQVQTKVACACSFFRQLISTCKIVVLKFQYPNQIALLCKAHSRVIQGSCKHCVCKLSVMGKYYQIKFMYYMASSFVSQDCFHLLDW